MLITLTGAAKAGKTETALSLASALAKDNKLVLLINANLSFDVLGIRLGKLIDKNKDFTNLLTEVNTDVIINDYIAKTNINNLYIMSIESKEKRLNAPVIIKEMAERLFFELSNMYDYIICDTYGFSDPLSLYALAKADVILSMQTLNIKSLIEAPLYNRLIHLLMQSNAKLYNVCSRHNEALELNDYENTIGMKFAFEIPFVRENREFEHQEKIYYLQYQKREMRKYKKAIEDILFYIGGEKISNE